MAKIDSALTKQLASFADAPVSVYGVQPPQYIGRQVVINRNTSRINLYNFDTGMGHEIMYPNVLNKASDGALISFVIYVLNMAKTSIESDKPFLDTVELNLKNNCDMLKLLYDNYYVRVNSMRDIHVKFDFYDRNLLAGSLEFSVAAVFGNITTYVIQKEVVCED